MSQRVGVLTASRHVKIAASTSTSADPYHIAALCKAEGLPVPVREHRFAEPRLWRFDYAWIERRIAMEVDGGVWDFAPGRHSRRQGYINDQRKRNAAQLRGWIVLCYTPQTLGECVADLRALLERGQKKGDGSRRPPLST